jgi:hypothetical protein
MANDIAPLVRSELVATGMLRVGINQGNFLLVTAMQPEPRGVAGVSVAPPAPRGS